MQANAPAPVVHALRAEPETDEPDRSDGSEGALVSADDGWPEGGLKEAAEVTFFSTPPAPPEVYWRDDTIAPPMPAQDRTAMYATLVMLAVTVFGIGGFMLVSASILPKPVRLAERPVLLPTPLSGAERGAQARETATSSTVASPANIATTGLAASERTAMPSDGNEGESSRDGTAPETREAPGPMEAKTAVDPPVAATPITAKPITAKPAGATTVTAKPVTTKPAGAKTVRSPARARKPSPTTLRQLVRQAYQQLNRGHFSRAESLAARATGLSPGSADAWMALGAARDAQGDTDGARRAYRLCVARVSGPASQACQRLAQ